MNPALRLGPARVSPFGTGAGLAVVVLALGPGLSLARAQQIQPTPAPAEAKAQDVSLDECRQHLVALETLTEACAEARDTKNCDPALVGLDDRVPLRSAPNPERRLVRYAWLRALFARAQRTDEAGQPSQMGRPESPWGTPRTTSQLLQDAQVRLAADLAQTDAQPGLEPAHASERAVLQQVLAGREFRNLRQPGTQQSALERFGNWVNKLFEGLGKLQVRAAWVGRALFWGFLLAVFVGLAWALLRLERRWRVRLLPDSDAPPPDAPSARDWQLWLKDARQAATAGLFREAIHFLYWAAISRLESKRVWPPDRARTPREYLALVAADDPRKAGLGALTREFEWTWYGGRPASENQYRRAEQLASTLIEGGGAQTGGQA